MGLIAKVKAFLTTAVHHPFISLIIVVIAVAVILLNEGAIRENAVGTVGFEVEYHSYMIGLVLPEGVFIGLIWNPVPRRYAFPMSGRFMPTWLGIVLTAAIAVLGVLVIAPAIRAGLDVFFTGWATGPLLNVIGYWLYAAFSLLYVPLLFVALSSPAGARRGLGSLRKLL